MSFEAGEVHVICPNCGAPVTCGVHISTVEVLSSQIRITFPQYGMLIDHKCEKLPR